VDARLFHLSVATGQELTLGTKQEHNVGAPSIAGDAPRLELGMQAMGKWPALSIFGLALAIVAAWSGSSESATQLNPMVAQLSSGAPALSRGRREMISWVVLSNTYVNLKRASLLKKLDDVYPGQFLPPNDKNFAVDGPTPAGFLIKSTVAGASGMFMLISVPGSYTEYSDFAEAVTDAALLRKIKAQCCWLSVDLIGQGAGEADGAYRFIEQVLARLAPPDAAFLVHPSKLVTIPFDDELRRRLANGEKIQAGP
jgi:hypothetical protein